MYQPNDEATTRWWASAVSRRSLLRGGVLGGVGLAAAALIGCGGGDDDDDDDSASTTTSGGSTTTSTTQTSGTTTTSQSGASAGTTTTTADDSSDDSDDTPAQGEGLLVQDPDLPYPYQFPEPAGVTPKPGGTLRVGVTFDVVTFDPTLSAAGGTITVPNMTYNKMLGMVDGVQKDPFKVELKPELAASWERSPDGATWTFQVQDGITWQNLPPLNGRPFVSGDLKYAHDRYASEGVHRSYWANISSTETPDDQTYVINMGTVTADFILPLASRYQTVFPRETVDDGTIADNPVGTGAMILTEAEQGSHMNFVKNPDYWEREVLLDGAEFLVQRDVAARLAAFRVGQIDFGYATGNTLPNLRNLLETNPDVQINLSPVTFGGIPFGMNLSNPKFQDERIRQALTLAFDTDLMEELIYENLSKTLPLQPWTWVWDEEPTVESGELGPWFGRYDPDEAKKLLKAAGAEDLEFDSIWYNYGPDHDTRTQIILAQLLDVGVTMNSQSVDYTEFNSTWVPAKLEQATTTGWLTAGFDADNAFYNSVHSASPGNRWRLNDPQVDAWAEAQQVELNPDARKDIHRTMMEYFLNVMYWPPMPSGISINVYQPWLRGIRWGGTDATNSYYYDWGHQIAGAWIDK
ncbi:MAG: ABC transporter substrate-binding protein [Chloroflexi bacterium]|nr:ABC transporter substrate-binding protein [Chloroflexota bacterium]